jgi:hypothetical protein
MKCGVSAILSKPTNPSINNYLWFLTSKPEDFDENTAVYFDSISSPCKQLGKF